MAQVFKSFKEIKSSTPRVVCLGNFDGFHRGHQKILKTCLENAKKQGLSSLLFSFSPHPRRFFLKAQASFPLLFQPADKMEILQDAGLDNLLFQDFDQDFSEIKAENFIEDILKNALSASTVVIGRGFRFGFKARGDALTFNLIQGIKLIECSDVLEGGESISSSRIRRLISEGQIEDANLCLGYPYFVSGSVVQGDGRGRSIGFPTANVQTAADCLPCHGVYSCLLELTNKKKLVPGVCNIGLRPSFEAGFSIEAHLFSFDENIVQEDVRLYFVDRIREEMKFSSVSELSEQIQIDCDTAKKNLFSLQKGQPGGWSVQKDFPGVFGALRQFKDLNLI